MRQTLVTASLAVGALALVFLLFLPRPPPEESPVARPLSTDRGPNGYLVARRWLEAEHVAVTPLQVRYAQLATDASLPASGNILLLTLPARDAITTAETSALDRWIERGNTLILMAALNDTPAWSATGGGRLVGEVRRLARLDMHADDDDSGATQDDAGSSAGQPALPARVDEVLRGHGATLKPHGSHPLLDGVRTLTVTSDLPSDRFSARPMDVTPVVDLLDIENSGAPAMWLRKLGRGQLITVAYAGLFSNRDLPTADNGKLLANLVSWYLTPGSRFLFDDARQGATRYMDAAAFYHDGRLHQTLLWLVLLWFVFVLGIRRLRPAQLDWRPQDVTGFLAVGGEFLASSAPPAAIGGRLLGNFFAALERDHAAPVDSAAAWAWLSNRLQSHPQDVAELRRMQTRIIDGRRVDLVALQTLLSRIQGTLA